MRNYYVIRHDFGYGKDVPLSEINKLDLRNFDDLQDYINVLISTVYINHKKDKNVLCFSDCKFKIKLESFI